ncbi:hypothetical protein Tco_1049772 [Tanacetum coccineum]
MEVGTTTNNLTARLPILNPGDYDLWLMRIEQYFLMTDYSLWEVIKNGNKVLRRTVGTVEQEPTKVPLISRCKVANGGYREEVCREQGVKEGSSSTSQNLQNVAFVSSNSTNSNSSTNEADNTTYGVSAAHTQSNPVNSTSVDNISDAVICDFLASQPNSPQLAR